MGVSTDGQICFGILLGDEEDDLELPWDDKRYEDLDDWWIDGVHGYKPPFELFDADGNYINGERPSEETIKAYYAPRWEFEKQHPIPVKLVNGCSGNYPVWILALKDVGFT